MMEEKIMKTTYTQSGNINDGQKSQRFSKSANLQLMFTSFVLLLLATFQLSAQHPAASELNLRLHDNAVFNIRVNNVEYNNFTSSYTVQNLNPGRHHIVITRYKVSSNGYSQSFQFPQVVFSGYITLRGKTREFAYIDQRGRYIVEQRMAMRTPAPVNSPANNRSPYQNTPPVYSQFTPVMSPYSFEMLRNTLAATSFDSSRLSVAQQAIAANNVTSEQVYQLMMMLSFESNRLKLAQFAYPYTVDKGNYFLVNNAFNFNASRNKLNSYIAQLR
jgi:hypothetical protein